MDGRAVPMVDWAMDEIRKSKEFVMAKTPYTLADIDRMDVGVFFRLIDEIISKKDGRD